tara:strand:+ start:2300 stop:3643 length:1344 start_codon:yes stop_codon:yes gene_type:complete
VGNKIIVIGSGICGLTCAYRLKQQGFDPIVLDRAERLGGRSITNKVNGFIDDLGGSLLATTYKEAVQLADELGLTSEREPMGAQTELYIDGKFHVMSINNAALSLLSAKFLNWRSKLSLIRLVPIMLKSWSKLNLTNLGGMADIDTESAQAFCRRTVTDEVYERLLNPLTRAMYGHDCSEISVVELLWMLKTFAACSTFAFKGGMETLPQALVAQGINVLTSHEVLDVRDSETGVVVRVKSPEGESELTADYCAIASDGKDLQRIYGQSLSAAQNDFLDQLCYNPLYLVYFKFKKRPPVKGFIVEFTAEEGGDMAALAWYHKWGDSKVPDDKSALIFLGTNDWQFRMQNLPVEESIAEAKRYVYKYYPELEAQELSVEVTPWPRATTVGRVGNYRHLHAFVNDRKHHGRVQYGGDYMAQSSIGTAVATGNDLAKRLLVVINNGLNNC